MGTISCPSVPSLSDGSCLPTPQLHQMHVKTEASLSPDLSPGLTSLKHFHFRFNPNTLPSHAHFPPLRTPSESPSGSTPLYRFGSDIPSEQGWPRPLSFHHLATPQTYNSNNAQSNGPNSLSSDFARPAMSYSDEYDASDLAELAAGPDRHSNGYGGLGTLSHEKAVRRRSSKGTRPNAIILNIAHT